MITGSRLAMSHSQHMRRPAGNVRWRYRSANHDARNARGDNLQPCYEHRPNKWLTCAPHTALADVDGGGGSARFVCPLTGPWRRARIVQSAFPEPTNGWPAGQRAGAALRRSPLLSGPAHGPLRGRIPQREGEISVNAARRYRDRPRCRSCPSAAIGSPRWSGR